MLNIVDIVSQYEQLTPEGDSHYSGKCPFCASDDPNNLILSQENPYWGLDKQAWSCLSCGAEGDRYDFVARLEHVSRAEAILMVAHHANSGDPFPHARFKVRTTPVTKEQAHAPGRTTDAKPAQRPSAAPAGGLQSPRGARQPAGMNDACTGELKTRLAKFRSIVPSYQGAAILHDASQSVILSDTEYTSSADLAAVAEALRPILLHAGTVFSDPGMQRAIPATLSLASEDQAILAHRFGEPGDKSMLLVVRLGNPSEVPVARRVMSSVFALPG